jgi:hypothetical protein
MCLDLGSTYRRLGSATVNFTGSAMFLFDVPEVLADRVVSFQAVVPAGVNSYKARVQSQFVQSNTVCQNTIDDFWDEAEAIRSCTTDQECGQVLTGTSCGCTRNWVARLNVDTTQFYDLVDEAGQCGLGLASTCDCPPAAGFACVSGECTWNYL